MAEHNEIGKLGEKVALRFLTLKGYTLIERNWKFERCEIDIIAECHGEIVFIEVKTRTDERYATALSSIHDNKFNNIVKAAQRYLAINRYEQPARIDTITVVGQPPHFKVKHYKGTSVQFQLKAK